MATTAAAGNIKRRRSNVNGWGVFAITPIPKNKHIVDYAGEKISQGRLGRFIMSFTRMHSGMTGSD